MFSLRKWMFKPKKSDSSNLAKFFYADEELNAVAAELDSFDGSKDPERCSSLVTKLRNCQDKVLTIIESIMVDVIPEQRASRDFRVKFPDDVVQENLAGQLWFGAECLAAGSSILNREVESASMRPLAKTLTRHLDYLRSIVRDHCLRNQTTYTDDIIEALTVFDKLFAEFELSYVSAMVPVKTMKEYDVLQEVIVLYCETVQRALKLGLLTQEMLDDYDPALMFTIPRLGMVAGLLVYPEGPLNPDMEPINMSEMFRNFQPLLYKIRELLWTLSRDELWLLEKSLCSVDEPPTSCQLTAPLASSLDTAYPHSGLLDQAAPSSLHQAADGLLDATEFHMMSHSFSTVTVVAAAEQDEQEQTSTSSSAEEESDEVEANRTQNMIHQDSADSGMEPDTAGKISSRPSMDSLDAKARRLRHSRSWPESQHDRQRIEEQEEDDDVGLGEDIQRSTITHRSGSRQFNFHLPLNTQLDNIGRPSQQVSPDDAAAADSSSSIIYAESSGADHVAFVTDALHGICLTDPAASANSHCDNICDSTMDNQDCLDKTTLRKPVDAACVVACSGKEGEEDVGQCTAGINTQLLKQHDKEVGGKPRECCHVRGRRPRLVRTRRSVEEPRPRRGAPRPDDLTDWDRESYASSDTSSYTSECQDDEEIALAIQSAEMTARREARARFKSSEDLIHRLFVCISGVADQLQTNYAADLRHILKTVFDAYCSLTEDEDQDEDDGKGEEEEVEEEEDVVAREAGDGASDHSSGEDDIQTACACEEPPHWVPDSESPHCMACKIPFSFVRRRHHCRNCGKIFCARCSSNSVCLPHYGHTKPVRVCNHCFMFQVTPFTVDD